ncbi:MAG: TIGR03761 family integrating conjugative element protein [Candidatus Thiodiazotropha endolucinida]|nr:TIGR03761 family integrating conjugative element protein [Candidatus Thiodiazotropha endolucinida]
MNTDQSHAPPADQQEAPRVGALRGQAWLTVQTRHAQQLIHGRQATPEKPAIIGLVGFADRLRLIWQAARHDDPYADWWLIKVHEALDQARHTIAEEQAAVDERMAGMTGIEVTVAKSLRPYRVPLQFANPYAYRGAQLIGEYDTLVRTLLSGYHVGLLDRESSQKVIHLAARKVRGAFAVPLGFRMLGIDRASLQQDSDKKAQARQLMGDLPLEVLNGEQRAPLVPHKAPFPNHVARAVVNKPLKSASTLSPVTDENTND